MHKSVSVALTQPLQLTGAMSAPAGSCVRGAVQEGRPRRHHSCQERGSRAPTEQPHTRRRHRSGGPKRLRARQPSGRLVNPLAGPRKRCRGASRCDCGRGLCCLWGADRERYGSGCEWGTCWGLGFRMRAAGNPRNCVRHPLVHLSGLRDRTHATCCPYAGRVAACAACCCHTAPVAASVCIMVWPCTAIQLMTCR